MIRMSTDKKSERKEKRNYQHGTRMTTIRSAISIAPGARRCKLTTFFSSLSGKKKDKVFVGLKPAPGLGAEDLGEPSDTDLFIRRELLPSPQQIKQPPVPGT